MTINQCDGCRRGLPINKDGTHWQTGAQWGAQKCTADRYKDEEDKIPDMSVD